MSVVQLNGVPATVADLAPLAFAGYAHFTAMQVRGGLVRGLDLHLARLHAASLQLSDIALPDDVVRGHLRSALAASALDCSLTVTLYCPAGEFAVAAAPVLPQVLVRTGPPSSGPQGPLRLAAVGHERLLPTIKHVGEIAKTYYLRQAAQQGLDDAAFVDRHGRLSEGTIWNLAFWDGHSVVWPQAAMLGGTMMAMVRRQLSRMDLPQRLQDVTVADLPSMRGAVVMNSWTPGVAISEIGGVSLPPAPELLELLHRAHRAEALSAP